MCSGKKQVRIVLSMYDADQLMQRDGGNYLARSAASLRSSVQPAFTSVENHLDRYPPLGGLVVHSVWLTALRFVAGATSVQRTTTSI
jgi:hypothetical protein